MAGAGAAAATPARRRSLCKRTHEQQRHWHVMQHAMGDAAEGEAFQAGPPMGGHDDEVSPRSAGQAVRDILSSGSGYGS